MPCASDIQGLHDRPVKNHLRPRRPSWLALFVLIAVSGQANASEGSSLEIGLAVRDITPELPIRLAGYASRERPADKVDHPLWVQALAIRNSSGERFVFVAIDNCEVSHAFMQPVLQQLADRFQLARGEVAVISSHTHSAPVLDQTLIDMAQPPPADRERIESYSRALRDKLVEVVGASLTSFLPAQLEYGLGRATFAMNRRVYQGDKVVFGDNPDGPVDWDVPVLRIKGTNGAVLAVLFGYACHGTSVRSGDDWYVVSGEYMAYARQHIEAHQPGSVAMFLPGMGADSDPAPRGRLLDARRHGLELAGAVVGVLDRPMRPVRGGFKSAYEEVDLPFVDPPGREQMEKDAKSQDVYTRLRAEAFLKKLNTGEPLPRTVKLPVAVVRLGDDLTFILMGGEVVVDYSRRLKRLLAADFPWPIAYAYEIPCYIPSVRLLKEGGYEAESSLIYYGFYGPFRTSIEDLLVSRVAALVAGLRTR
jgi:neutral ceramidase